MVSKMPTINKKWWLIGGVIVVLALALAGTCWFLGVFENKGIANLKNQVKLDEASQTNKTFSKAELAKYNGRDGQPSYVAVSGVVYDLSVVFKNGTHHSHQAGEELTDAFFSKHAANRIQKYPVVGLYTK